MASQEEAVAVLQRLFDWTYNSMAAYILESQPHIPGGKEELFLRLGSIVEEQRLFSDEIALFMREYGAVPHIHPHDPSFAELNFLSIDYLSAALKTKLAEYLVQLERDCSDLEGNTKMLKLIENLREVFRREQSRC